MNQRRNLIVIILAAVLLVGLVVLALNLDAGSGTDVTQTQGSEETTDKTSGIWDLTYQEYLAMTKQEQDDFYHKFDPEEDFFKWYKAAKKTYEDNSNNIIIGGDGSIDLGDILNGNK